MEDLPNKIYEHLLWEMDNNAKGGLYHKSQIAFAYNSNRIEGSRISEEETSQIFETGSLLFSKDDAKPVNDIIETVNHFRAFDLMLQTVNNSLTPELIKQYHNTLKSGIQITKPDYQIIGDWKRYPNFVGDMETVAPDNVQREIENLLERSIHNIDDIAVFHYQFEKIHPFFDGNGRVGRLIMFKQCLEVGISPFILLNEQKAYYYRGLKEFESDRAYLIGTFEQAQDVYVKIAEGFLGGSMA